MFLLFWNAAMLGKQFSPGVILARLAYWRSLAVEMFLQHSPVAQQAPNDILPHLHLKL